MYSKVTIHALLLDPITDRPILVLKSEGGGKMLPIWIGTSEANAIALEIEKIRVPRPMTHDLICGIMETAGIAVQRIHICDLRENTYFAEIVLRQKDHDIPIDARPSDAVAIAVRTGAPIFVKDAVFERYAEPDGAGESSGDCLRQWLEGLSSEELGHYRM